MAYAYFALYTGDYLRDTRHLSCSEHGIYLLFLMFCWDCREPVPLDEKKAAAICNARSGDEIEAMRRVLREFFVCRDDGWYNPRIVKEIERAEALSHIWIEAGKRGAEMRKTLAIAKAKPRLRVGQASDTTPPPPLTPPLTQTPKGEAVAPSPPGIDAANTVISIPLNNNSEFPVSRSNLEEWEKLYPECDVMQTLREIRGWNLANPTRRKTKSGVMNHINRWLAKEHNRG